MIARHSLEQSDRGEGVEVMENRECLDPVHGKGQYTEKRIHLSRLDSIAQYLSLNYTVNIILFQPVAVLGSSLNS